MTRILKSAIFVLAILYFLVDAFFLKIAKPLAVWTAKRRLFVGLRKWIVSLRPYPTLALFVIPLIVLEPVKPLAAYLIGTGRLTAGTATLVLGEIFKLVIVERLFRVCRPKLMRISMFKWCYGFWRQGVDWLTSMKAWQAIRRWKAKIKHVVQGLISRLKASRKHGQLIARSRSSI